MINSVEGSAQIHKSQNGDRARISSIQEVIKNTRAIIDEKGELTGRCAKDCFDQDDKEAGQEKNSQYGWTQMTDLKET